MNILANGLFRIQSVGHASPRAESIATAVQTRKAKAPARAGSHGFPVRRE
jgi:hypothetical protein